MTATAVVLASALLLAAVPPAPSQEAFEAEWRAWREKRLAGLQKPQGWLALRSWDAESPGRGVAPAVQGRAVVGALPLASR